MDPKEYKTIICQYIKAPTKADGAFISIPYNISCDWCQEEIPNTVKKHFKRRDIDSRTWQGKCDCGKECRFKMKKKYSV